MTRIPPNLADVIDRQLGDGAAAWIALRLADLGTCELGSVVVDGDRVRVLVRWARQDRAADWWIVTRDRLGLPRHRRADGRPGEVIGRVAAPLPHDPGLPSPGSPGRTRSRAISSPAPRASEQPRGSAGARDPPSTRRGTHVPFCLTPPPSLRKIVRMTEPLIRLDALARRLGMDPNTAAAWRKRGMIESTNLGRGRGRGAFLSREQAIEVVALAMLRRAGVPSIRLAEVVRALRVRGKHGADFLALGSFGKTILLDGVAPTAPLADPRTGQAYLGIVLDLRPMRETIDRVIRELEAARAKAKIVFKLPDDDGPIVHRRRRKRKRPRRMVAAHAIPKAKL